MDLIKYLGFEKSEKYIRIAYSYRCYKKRTSEGNQRTLLLLHSGSQSLC